MYRTIPYASIILVSLASVGVAGCNQATGTHARANAPAEATPIHPGVVILVRERDHVLAALRTIQDLRRQVPTPSQYRVLVCGPGLRALTKGSSITPQIRAALDRHVVIEACGMAMNKQGMKPDALLAGVAVVPNALAESVTLQLQGWVSVEL